MVSYSLKSLESFLKFTIFFCLSSASIADWMRLITLTCCSDNFTIISMACLDHANILVFRFQLITHSMEDTCICELHVYQGTLFLGSFNRFGLITWTIALSSLLLCLHYLDDLCIPSPPDFHHGLQMESGF